MPKTLTITLDDDVYERIKETIGVDNFNHFLTDLIRPGSSIHDLENKYREMAMDRDREKEAEEWTEKLNQDFCDEM